MSETAPQHIGDYEIIRELGHGGMGKVYLVRNVLSDRVEAMKVVLPDLAGNKEFIDRFMREIRTLAALEHPNIAALRTAFTAGNQFVMIMEYVEGVTLAERLQQGPFSTSDALNYTQQALSALSYAHSKHVIHRDIKPGNMMLTRQGVVKLMDFGLARSADEVGLTMTGATLGSLDYTSPEQVQSQPTDERSDLYSVGVSLYQMVTGQRMFSVTSSFSIMQAQVKQIPRQPVEFVPSLPKALNDTIMKAVAKDPAQRFQSAEVFRGVLSQIASGEDVSHSLSSDLPATAAVQRTFDPGFTVPAGSEPRNGRNVMLLVAVVVIAALLAGAAAYKSHQRRALDSAVLAPVQASPPSADNTPGGNAADQTTDSSATHASPSPALPPQPEPAKPAPAGAQPIRTAHKSGTPAGGLDTVQGPTADEVQGQHAAAEQRKLLDAMETEIDQLDSRAISVESSLDALEQQMHHDGLGLRGDVVAARSSMRTDIARAKQAMDSSDTERARRYLDLSHQQIERLEAFLGRR